MSEAKALSITDAESVEKAILQLVLKYPGYPASFKATNSTVLWNNTAKVTSIGLYPMQGAIYLKQYVSSNYIAQFPFRIVYKSSLTTNNNTQISAQTMLEDLCKWLEPCSIGFANDTHIQLQSIKRMSPVYCANIDATSMSLAADMQVQYSFMK